MYTTCKATCYRLNIKHQAGKWLKLTEPQQHGVENEAYYYTTTLYAQNYWDTWPFNETLTGSRSLLCSFNTGICAHTFHKALRSGLCAGHTEIIQQVLMDPALCPGAPPCWNRKEPAFIQSSQPEQCSQEGKILSESSKHMTSPCPADSSLHRPCFHCSSPAAGRFTPLYQTGTNLSHEAPAALSVLTLRPGEVWSSLQWNQNVGDLLCDFTWSSASWLRCYCSLLWKVFTDDKGISNREIHLKIELSLTEPHVKPLGSSEKPMCPNTFAHIIHYKLQTADRRSGSDFK